MYEQQTDGILDSNKMQAKLKHGIGQIARVVTWLWARSQQILLTPGFRAVQQVKENCGALLSGKLAGDQMQEIETLLERI